MMPHLIVSYDVVDDNRRNRLAKLLKGYLQRVQKSVFEGELTARRHHTLRSRIEKVIDQDEDSVRIYLLCRRCVPALEIVGTGVPVEPPDEDIFV
ncbi:MAG: CRISPR-associated endonuclease Cas2 [Acidobacteriota bacterium]|nr:CRISPR-associated endonuclease Cas2 [Acidobacteriota bacterium]MDQ7086530.1 CRISPR-associated endonuclease Cas2 [Acidobacteriota bacterium]